METFLPSFLWIITQIFKSFSSSGQNSFLHLLTILFWFIHLSKSWLFFQSMIFDSGTSKCQPASWFSLSLELLSGSDANSCQLCSNTVLRIDCDESINNRHCVANTVMEVVSSVHVNHSINWGFFCDVKCCKVSFPMSVPRINDTSGYQILLLKPES